MVSNQANSNGSSNRAKSYLSEGRRVKAVLAGDLEPNVVAGFGVPGSFGASLHLSIDSVVIASREKREIVVGSDSSGILGQTVANCSGVLRNGGLLDIIAGLSANQETFVSQNSVKVGGGSFQEVKESTSVQVGLLEVEV
jgi:hypothetical protein